MCESCIQMSNFANEIILKALALCWPFIVGDAEPCGITVVVLDDEVLAECALIAEPEALRCRFAGRIAVITLPFYTAIPERVEKVGQQQIHRFGVDP